MSREQRVISVLPLGRERSPGEEGDLGAPAWQGEIIGSRTKLYEGWKGIRGRRISFVFLFFVLNLVIVSSIQNLTAINHDS
jgi:hypothetical protein